MSKRAVIQLADYGGPYAGNFIASLQALDGALARSGIQQVLVFSDTVKGRPWLTELQKNGTRVYMLRKNDSVWNQAREIVKIASNEEACVFHSHFTTFDVPAWLAARRLKARGRTVSVLWHVHSSFPVSPSPTRHLKDALKFRYMARTVQTIAVSPHVLHAVEKRGLTTSRRTVIANGVDISRARYATMTRRQVRNELSLSEDDVVLLQFGWDPRIKGVDISLAAVTCLIEQGLPVKLVLVGGRQMQTWVTDLYPSGLPRWLRVVGPQEIVGNYYRASDIFVSASRAEGFSYAVGEAMASGLPIVASDIEGVGWAFGAAGVISFRGADAGSLVSAVKQVIAWPADVRNERTSANSTFVEQRYSLDSWVAQVLETYETPIG